MRGKIRNQLGTVALPRFGIAQCIQLQRRRNAQHAPQIRAHHDQLGIDIWARKSQRLDPHLVKLSIASFLRALVTEHRAGVPQAFTAVVQHIVLHDRTYGGRCALGAQCQRFTVQFIDEGIHFLLDDVGDFADCAFEQTGLLQNRRANFAITIAA